MMANKLGFKFTWEIIPWGTYDRSRGVWTNMAGKVRAANSFGTHAVACNLIEIFQLVNNTLDFGNGACGLTEPYSRVIKISWPTRTVQIYWWSRLATS